MITMDPELLEILACPSCHSSLRVADDELACTNGSCGLVYPVRDEVPVLLVDEARRTEQPEPEQPGTGQAAGGQDFGEASDHATSARGGPEEDEEETDTEGTGDGYMDGDKPD